MLALQGGGALGAYQVGVYQAMYEAGIEPDWVIGTSIGAINGAVIVGNEPQRRLDQLARFWDLLASPSCRTGTGNTTDVERWWSCLAAVMQGVAGFFRPNAAALCGPKAPLGVELAAFYTTAPLRDTLGPLIDPDLPNRGAPRFNVGTVNARTGEMRHFDSRRDHLRIEHVMASSALPPGLPAVRIDGEPYWDGGLYSNTPIEAVLDDEPRRSSTLFAVHLWHSSGAEPDSILQVLGRQKEIRYSSRAASHVARQKQIHRLRRVISELAARIPERELESARVRELAASGCRTTMHIVQLRAPPAASDTFAMDLDFTSHGVRSRWQAGYADACRAIAQAPWTRDGDPLEGVFVHDYGAAAAGAETETP